MKHDNKIRYNAKIFIQELRSRPHVKHRFLEWQTTDANDDRSNHLQLQLCSSPVSPLGIVADLIVVLHPYPLWNGTILFHLFRQFSFDSKRFKSRHFASCRSESSNISLV